MSCKRLARCVSQSPVRRPNEHAQRALQHLPAQRFRALHYDGRNRLSQFWTPTTLLKPADAQNIAQTSSHDLLVRAGFLRQTHAGIFHLLPLGLRVQDKLERLIDKHMVSLGASKLSLSSLSSEDLWARSGRLKGRDSEFLRLTDRKGAKFLLSPTHEEEITTVVANAVSSYKDLPLRLYQVSRKYRDEARPRQGLLRGREFLMKDLYTFDTTEEQAIATYHDVRRAYRAILDELRLPYLVADADSGNMGGSLSHEYHFVSPSGEDSIITCKECDYAVNEELFAAPWTAGSSPTAETSDSYLITKDRSKVYKLVTPSTGGALNLHAIKQLLPDIDTSVDDVSSLWRESNAADGPVETIYDPRCQPDGSLSLNGRPILLTKAQENDHCPSCSKPSLSITQAVEIGHTFHLSTRYSLPLGASVLDANNKQMPIQMGCHGIGVSRLIAAVSGLLADENGLNWPLAVAPFQAVVIATPTLPLEDVQSVYDDLTQNLKTVLPDMDVTIDDRQRQLGWKLNDADLIGYPFIIVLGRSWRNERKVELQCRRLGIKENVALGELPSMLQQLVSKL